MEHLLSSVLAMRDLIGQQHETIERLQEVTQEMAGQRDMLGFLVALLFGTNAASLVLCWFAH